MLELDEVREVYESGEQILKLQREIQELEQENQGLREDIMDIKDLYQAQLNILVKDNVSLPPSPDDEEEDVQQISDTFSGNPSSTPL